MSVSSGTGGEAVRLKRDRQRITSNIPTYAIVLGALFIVVGAITLVAFWRSIDGLAERSVLGLFGGMFIFVGALLSGYAIRGRRLRQRIETEGGRAPWRFDNKWDSRGTDDGSSRTVRGNAIAIAAFIVFLLPFHLLAATRHALGLWLFLSLFDLVVLIFAWQTVVRLSRRLALGGSRVLFRQFPYLTGQNVQLSFSGGDKFRNCHNLKAVLHCIREYYEWRGRGRNQASTPVVESMWRTETTFTTDPSGAAELCFEIPDNVPGSDLVGVPDQKPPVYWELEVTGEVSNTPYQGIFLIPIYRPGSLTGTEPLPMELAGLPTTTAEAEPPKRVRALEAIVLFLFFSFFVAMGSLVVVQDTKRLVRNYHLVHSGRTATGRVVDYKQSRGGRTGTIWPVVTYVTADGRSVTFESAYHPDYSGYGMGDQVPVVYDPARPEVAEINEHERLWGKAWASFTIGGIFILFGCGGIIFIVVRLRRQKPRRQVGYHT